VLKESTIQVQCVKAGVEDAAVTAAAVAVDAVASVSLAPPPLSLDRAHSSSDALPGVMMGIGRQFSEESVQFGDCLVVHLRSARDLIACDWNGFSDPYVVFSFVSRRTQQARSSMKKSTLSPEWVRRACLC
jgi:Ca2+-dependent lipid-binding protein